MKFFAVLAGFMLLLLGGIQVGGNLFSSVSERTNLAASFINDSVIIDVDDSTLDSDVIPEADSDVVPTETGSDTPIVFSDDSDESENTIDTVVIEVTQNSDSGTNSSSNNTVSDDGGTNTENTNGSSNTTQQTVSAQSILQTLTGSQAITNSGVSSSGGGGTSVSGDKTREALRSRSITKLSIPTASAWGTAATSRSPYSRADLALIVSAALVTIPELDDVFYTTNALSITYKANGRLLFALPVPYMATLDLTFDEQTTKKRVKVKFPWYKFFMYTGVSKGKLRAAVDNVITRTPTGEDYDRAAAIFDEVANLLQTTRGFRGLQ